MATIFPVLIALTLCFPICMAEYKTRMYKGSSYTYAGEEKGDYNETIEWCRQLNGSLPAVQTEADLSFMILLVGRHRDAAGIFLHPVLTNDLVGGPSWYEECNGSCCGKVLKTVMQERANIMKTDICSVIKRRKVCKLDRNAKVVDHNPVTTTTPKPDPVNKRIVYGRFTVQHDRMMQKVHSLMEKMEALEESIPDVIQSKVIQVRASEATVELKMLNGGLDSLSHRITFLTFGIIMFVTVGIITKMIPVFQQMKRKKRSREPISLRDLVGSGV